jgi:hypothetical protein
MAIDHHLEQPQPHQSAEASTFKSAEQGANHAFQSEVQKSQASGQKPAHDQVASLGLPNVNFFDSSKNTFDLPKGSADLPLKGHDLSSGKIDAVPGAEGPRIGDDLKGRIVKAIGTNEGDLTHITKNDAGHGISVGIRQWNQKRGELPDLLKSMHDKNPEKFDSTFGSYAKNLQNEKYVRHTDMAHNPDLMKRMGKALADPEFQQLQIDKARDFAQKSIDTAQKFGLKTEQGAALVADITNQLGQGGFNRAAHRAGLHQGADVSNEQAALQRLEHTSHRPNSRDRFNNIAGTFNLSDPIKHRILDDRTVHVA